MTYTYILSVVLMAVQVSDAFAEKHDALTIDEKLTVLEQRINNLEAENIDLKVKDDTLQQQIRNLEAENIDLKVKDETLQQKIMNLEAENIDLKDKIENSENEKIEFWIGFSAYATRDRDYESGDTIMYDGVVTNRGSFYNPLTSIFACPFSGYYLFAVTSKAPYGDYIYTEMIVGNTVVAATYAYSGADSASNIALVECEVDVEVSVRLVREIGSTGRLVGDDKPESTFSGTLLSLAQNIEFGMDD